MIEQIKRALEQITEGEWKMGDMDTAYSNEVFVNPTEHVYREIAGGMRIEDALLVANAPEWIRYLIGEVEQVHEDKKNMVANWNAALKRADRAEAEVRELQKALEHCGNGGNSLASVLIGWDLPKGWQDWTHSEASEHFYANYSFLDTSIAYEKYEVWLCWKSIRMANQALEVE